MPDINPLTNNQIFLKKIAENTGSDYETGDISEINPLTIDQIFLKEIAANTTGQSGDITELEEKVSATQDMISDAYDSTHTYNVGDYCIHENVLYKCKTASTTGTWDSSKWGDVTVADELGELKDKVVGFTQYTDNNPYNVWTEHTVNISGFTAIHSVTMSAINPTLTIDGTLHDASLIKFTDNSVTYAVKGGWSGGLNGVSVSFVICGE